MEVDFGRAAKDYARYRAGFPESFFARLSSLGLVGPGHRALDLGTGTGTVARSLARLGCETTGLDPSETLLAEARRLDAEAGVHVRYVEAKAEATGLPGESFDLITAGQAWHWFDRPRAAAESSRLLVAGGALVIAHFDWIPLPGNIVEETERLIEKHNPAWKFGGGTGLHPAWLADVALAGFSGIETFSFDEPVSYSHEAWRGRIRASAGVSASLAPEAVGRFDAELSRLLALRFPQDPLAVPHRVFAVLSRKPRAG